MKKYALYGDDDQQRLNEIWEKEESIQKMVDLSNHKLLQERQKLSKKNKPYDTTVNNKRPEQVNDVNPAKPAVKKERFVKEEEKKKEKKKKEKSEKKKSKKLAAIIGLVLVAAIIGGVLWTFKPEVMALVERFTNQGTETVVEKIEGEGYLTTAEDKEYTIKEVLQQSKIANDALQNYYTSLQNVVNAKSDDMVAMVNEMQTEVKNDLRKFQSYQKQFSNYEGGLEYYNTIQSRFNNLDNILNYLSFTQGDIAAYVNRQIDLENEYITESAEALKSFLDLNNISYTETDNKIEYKV